MQNVKPISVSKLMETMYHTAELQGNAALQSRAKILISKNAANWGNLFQREDKDT